MYLLIWILGRGAGAYGRCFNGPRRGTCGNIAFMTNVDEQIDRARAKLLDAEPGSREAYVAMAELEGVLLADLSDAAEGGLALALASARIDRDVRLLKLIARERAKYVAELEAAAAKAAPGVPS